MNELHATTQRVDVADYYDVNHDHQIPEPRAGSIGYSEDNMKDYLSGQERAEEVESCVQTRNLDA